MRGKAAELMEYTGGRKMLNVFAWSQADFIKLYRWNNSLAHGAMAGVLVFCRHDVDKFLADMGNLVREVPLNVRRYE